MIENPHEIEARIQDLDDRLNKIVTETERRAQAFADTDADYRAAYAKAVLKIRDSERGLPRGQRCTVDEVEARAAVETQNEYRAMRAAETLFKSVQSAQRARQSQMEGQRSLCASTRFLLERGAA